MLLAHLPPDSHTARAIDPKAADDARWTLTDHLLAAVFDALNILIWQNANTGKEIPSPRPRPLPRPGFEDTSVVRLGTPRPLSEVKALLPGIQEADRAG